MNQKTIRWVDKYIGCFVCFILTIHRWLSISFRNGSHSHQKPSKILFIKLIEQGTTVLAYPALKKAVDSVGRDNVYFMVFEKNRPILDVLGIIPASNIIGLRSGNLFVFIRYALKAIGDVRRNKIDAVIDMESFSRGSAILAYLCGASIRVGLHNFTNEGPYRGDLFTHRLLYNPFLHMKYFFVSLVEALYHNLPEENAPLLFEIPDVSDDLPRFSSDKEEKKKVIQKIERTKKLVPGQPIILLNPNVSDMLPIRRWPKENFIALGKKLLEKWPEGSIIVTGRQEGEREEAGKVASQIPGAVLLAGETTLKELLTLYNMADLLVTSDSGPAHFSALTPIKAIVLFGPETPKLYGLWQDKVVNISSEFICSPCVNAYNYRQSPCQTASCLKSITVDEVYVKAQQFLR